MRDVGYVMCDAGLRYGIMGMMVTECGTMNVEYWTPDLLGREGSAYPIFYFQVRNISKVFNITCYKDHFMLNSD